MKRRMARIFAVFVAAALLTAGLAGAAWAIPQLINYQGKLTDSGGTPITGSRSMVFSLYTVSTGGTSVWTETLTVNVTDGIFNASLGGVTPIPVSVFTNDTVYLGVKVGTDSEMSPRQRITSGGYVYKANDIADGAVTNAKLSGTIADSHLSTNVELLGTAQTVTAVKTFNPSTGTVPFSVDATKNAVVTNLNADLLDGSDASAFDQLGSAQTITGVKTFNPSTGSVPFSVNSSKNATVTNLNADTLDGKHSSDLVLKAGDTMTGNLAISGAGHGITFPDGSTQTSAVAGGGSGVPSGFFILGDTAAAPTGYVYTGINIDAVAKWESIGDMPAAMSKHAAVGYGTKVFSVGQAGNLEYDINTDAWTTKAAMPTSRADIAAAAYNNKLYAIGGSGPSNVNEEYNMTANTWASRAVMPTARSAAAAACLNGKIYVVGGKSSGFLGTNEVYDPQANVWATKASMPTPRGYLGLAVANGKIYAVGGMDVNGNLKKNEEYDPATNIWTTKADIPASVFQINDMTFTSIGMNNRVYALGGVGAVGSLSSASYEYEPLTNSWKTSYAGGPQRYNFALATVGNCIYATGGEYGNSTYTPQPDVSRFEYYTYCIHKKE